MDRIEWRRPYEESRVGRAAAVVALAPVLAGALGVAALLFALAPSLAETAQANPELLALAVLLLLVSGPGSLFALWPVLTDPEQRVGLGLPSGLPLEPRLLAASLIVGIAGHAVALWLTPSGPLAFLAVCGGGGFLVVGLTSSAGEIDPDARTLVFHPDVYAERHPTRVVDLDTWTALRRYRPGDIVVLRPTYAPGHRGPSVVTLPTRIDERARPVFEAGVRADCDSPEREPNRLVQAVLVAFAALFAGVGAVAWTLEAAPPGIGLYLLVVCGGMALLFLLLASREG